MTQKSRVDYSEYTYGRFKERGFHAYAERAEKPPSERGGYSGADVSKKTPDYACSPDVVDINPSDLKAAKKEELDGLGVTNGGFDEKNGNYGKENIFAGGFYSADKTDGFFTRGAPHKSDKPNGFFNSNKSNQNDGRNAFLNTGKPNESGKTNDFFNSDSGKTPESEKLRANRELLGGKILAVLKKKLNADGKKNFARVATRLARPKKIAAAVCALVIAASFALLAADYAGGGAVSAGVGLGNYAITYYAVCLGEFDDLGEAKSAAAEIMRRGAAGYVIRDKNYKLAAAVYVSQADAERIAERNKNSGAFVYKISLKKVNLNAYSESERRLAERLLGYGGMVYGELYALSNALDGGRTETASARNKIRALQSEIAVLADETDSAPSAAPIFSKIKNDLIAASAAIAYLLTDAALEPSLTANIRYTYVMILNMYRALLNDF
ncbi:MAG: hypothetical protein LBP79_00620 [Clostridiales bacterium]|jgi:hypothetical protein|nr:hypothetical protein [Clostridiales bacterium]